MLTLLIISLFLEAHQTYDISMMYKLSGKISASCTLLDHQCVTGIWLTTMSDHEGYHSQKEEFRHILPGILHSILALLINA